MTDLLSQVVAQYGTASFGGMLFDGLFPAPEGVTNANALKSGLEIIGQLGINAFVTWQGFNLLYSRNIISANDPSKNVVYFMALYNAQPNLETKMKNMNGWLKSKFNGLYFSTSAEVKAVRHLNTKNTNMDFTSQFTEETDRNVQMSDFTPLTDE
jgi:hypothetical protein